VCWWKNIGEVKEKENELKNNVKVREREAVAVGRYHKG
jgi:hypothetical protein